MQSDEVNKLKIAKMKRHEESKLIMLLNFCGYTEEQTEQILDLIDNANRDDRDMENLLENLNNDLED